jgi:putative spermidine/putrescine transport system permease protein
MTRRAHRAFDPSLLILPAFALLILLFVIPLVWFFIGVLAEEGSVGAVIERFVDVLSAPGIVNALVATNWISALVTALTLVIGYPIAYYLANSTGWRFALVLFCIIVPYFTSVIVRTYSWMVLLGRNGAINQTLLSLGVIDAPLQLLYNKMGVLIGMTYVLMPYMVLTLYATMRGIDTNLVRAAYGLGASPLYTFRKVYFPLSLHGVISGALIVFILAIGFFITPALMGGPSDVMIAMLIERAVEITLDWTSAAIMSMALLAMTLVLYVVYYRVTDVRRMMGA